MTTGADDLVLYGLVMGSAGVAGSVAFPAVQQLWARWTELSDQYRDAKAVKATKALDEIFVDVQTHRLKMAYGLAPLLLGGTVFVLLKNLWLTLLCAAAGAILPDLWVRYVKARRTIKFHSQLVDSLFIVSSSLKAGLSLIQALEVVQEEMTPPISQEFGLVVRAHRLGRSFEEALQTLNDRIPSDEVNLITTALLVGRETGGDVTEIIGQLITTIREKKKLTDKSRTLTLQGRMQAFIMSVLPIGFATLIKIFNPHYFDPLLQTGVGRMLIMIAVILWVCGVLVLRKFCKVEI